jgi:hypothetical protein
LIAFSWRETASTSFENALAKAEISFLHLSLRERSTAEGRRVRVYGFTG